MPYTYHKKHKKHAKTGGNYPPAVIAQFFTQEFLQLEKTFGKSNGVQKVILHPRTQGDVPSSPEVGE